MRFERPSDQLKREIDRLIDRLANGIGDPYLIGFRSTDLFHEREAVLAEPETARRALQLVSPHPAILKRHEELLENLQRAMAAGIRSGDQECAEANTGAGRNRDRLSRSVLLSLRRDRSGAHDNPFWPQSRMHAPRSGAQASLHFPRQRQLRHSAASGRHTADVTSDVEADLVGPIDVRWVLLSDVLC